jgi:hypothetical protein
MRTVVGLVLTATCLLLGVKSFAQNDPCSVRIVNKISTEKPLTSAEVAHHALVTTPPRSSASFIGATLSSS